jgi:putative spermidine/putrescine transport system permease protein
VTATTAGRRRRRRLPDWTRPWLLLAPALFVVHVLFTGGLVLGFLQSLNYMPLIGKNDFNLDAYAAIFNDRVFWESLWLSLKIAFISTAISIVLAVGTALLIFHTERGRRIATFIYQFNLPIPHIVGAVAMLFLLAQGGLLSRVAFALGLTDSPGDFPAMTNDRGAVGIIAEYVWKETIFIGVVVLAALARGVGDYEDLARTLGAGRWKRFWHVILPLITPAIVSTSVIVFAFGFGAFEVPFLLGQPFPAALPVLAYNAFTDVDLNARSEAMAIAMVIAVITAVAVFVYTWLSRRYLRSES